MSINKIIEAYLNEVTLDKEQAVYLNPQHKSYPYKFLFKVGKIVNYSTFKYYLFYAISFLCANISFCVDIYILLNFLFSLFITGGQRKTYSDLNIGFIESEKTTYDIGLTAIKPILNISISYKDFASHCSQKEKIRALRLSLQVLSCVRKSRKQFSRLEYSSLTLHLNDLYTLSMYYILLLKLKAKNAKSIILNSHYERWTYLASHICGDLLILVQHGRLRKGIKFNYQFGNVSKVFCYNNDSLDKYKSYYKLIRDIIYIKPKLSFSKTKYHEIGSNIIFIASSIAAVEQEIDFIEQLLPYTKLHKIKILVKLHPLYDYEYRYRHLDKKVYFVARDIFPEADYMVTYNSSLGDEYLSCGYEVLFLEEYLNVSEAVLVTLKYFIKKSSLKENNLAI